MNSGLAEEGEGAYGWLEEPDLPFRYHFALVRRLVGEVDLRQRRVLEIAAGRGGNCDFLRRYTSASTIVGIDPCLTGLDRARHLFEPLCAGPDDEVRRAPYLVAGDAACLPLGDGTFDVVLNIEWSPSYPDFETFFGEIYRVLAPGGLFLYEDLWSRKSQRLDFVARRRVLLDCGLELVEEEDVSEQAFAALADPAGLESTLRAVQTPANRELVEKSLREAAAAKAALAIGFGSARILRLQKPLCSSRRSA